CHPCFAPPSGAEISALAPPTAATPGRRRGVPAVPPARVRAAPRARSRVNFRTAARDRRSAPALVRAIRRCARARRRLARRPARRGPPRPPLELLDNPPSAEGSPCCTHACLALGGAREAAGVFFGVPGTSGPQKAQPTHGRVFVFGVIAAPSPLAEPIAVARSWRTPPSQPRAVALWSAIAKGLSGTRVSRFQEL